MVTTPRRVGDPAFPEAGGAPLSARLLGRPRFAWRGRPLEIRSRKERALLAHLAARDAAVPRAELAELLWGPGRLRNVRQALYGLRRQPGADAWLAEEDEGVRVVADCDLLAFETAVARGEHAAALALWSDGLLEGLGVDDAPAFADWREVERERLATLYRDALRGRIRELEADDLPREALAAAERLLAADDLDEGAHRAAMRAAHRLHGRDAAARRFETCRRILRTELGVDPSDETRRLAAALGRDEPLPPPARERPAAPARPPLRPRLHGRATARRELEAALAEGTTVLVTGPAGIGKTRLVREVLSHRPAVRLSGGHEGDRHAPYATVARILAQALRDRPELAGPPARRAELARLLPETLGAAQAENATRGGDEARERLRGAVLTTLATACEGTTLVLDDLRHADEASLELVAALATTATPSPGRPRLVLVAREEEGRADLAERLRRLVAAGARAVRLGGLDAEAVEALLADLGAPALPTGGDLRVLARRLQRYTGGNPMFVLETVAHLAARHERLDAGVAFVLPDRVGALLRHRLDALPPDALRVARALHLLGPDADAELVARVVDADPARHLEALGALDAAHVLHEDRFAHDLVREAIEAHTPAAVRRFLHARAARALEAGSGPREPGRIAEHWLGAGEPARAAPHLVAAARQALERFEDDDARRRLFAALWASSTMREGAPALRAEALLALEAIAARRGDEDEAAWALAEAEALAAREQDDALLFETHLRRAAERIRRGRPGDAAVEAETALAIGERTGRDAWIARGAIQAGGAAFAAGDLGRASQAFERAAGTDDATVRLRAVANLGAVAGIRGDAAEARRRQEEALTLARAHGTLDQVAALLNNLAATDEREGRYARASERFAEAVTLARRSGDVAKERAARLNLVEVDAKRGAFASAERALAQLEGALPAATPAVAGRARLLRGELACALGRPGLAVRAFEEALALAREGDDRRAEAIASFDLARARALEDGSGDVEDVREALDALEEAGLEDVAAWARLELTWVASDADLARTGIEAIEEGDASPHRALLVELARHRVARATGAERPDRATLAALAARAPVAETPIAHGLLAATSPDAATARRHRERAEALLRDQVRGLPDDAAARRRRVVDDAVRRLV